MISSWRELACNTAIKNPYDVCVKIRLLRGAGTWEGDGDLPEFADYVPPLGEPCNVVIVDRRDRNAVVKYVLDSSYITNGGLCVLLDARRGIEGDLKYPALTDTSNYQPSDKRMLKIKGNLQMVAALVGGLDNRKKDYVEFSRIIFQ